MLGWLSRVVPMESVLIGGPCAQSALGLAEEMRDSESSKSADFVRQGFCGGF